MALPRYAADPPALRRTVPLDGLTLLYHRPSGTTHVVAAPVPELLDLLGAGPADAAELLLRLGAQFDLGGEGDLHALISGRLAELEVSGLVFRS